MPDKSRNKRKSHSAEKTLSFLEPAIWRSLQDADNDQEYAGSWLVLQALMIPSTLSGMVGFGSTESDNFAPVAFYPKDLQDRTHFVRAVEQVFVERKGVVLRHDSGLDQSLLVGYPLWCDGELDGVAVLEIEPRPQDQLQTVMRQLQWGCAWLQNRLLCQQIEPYKAAHERLQTVLELALAALQEDTYNAAALKAVTEIAQLFDCNRVSIGYIRRRQAHLGAVSHSAKFGREMNLIRLIEKAMDEAMDQGQPVLYPIPDEDSRALTCRAHCELANQNGGTSIASFPFLDSRGESYGVITFERSSGELFTEELFDFFAIAADLLGPLLEEKRLNDRHILSKITASGRTQLNRLVGPRYMAAKLLVCLLIVVTVFFAFAVGDYRVTAKASIEGQVQRALVAPFGGYLYSADASAGDIVVKGQQLATLDDRDLQVKRNKWASERAQHQLEYNRAMADSDIAAAKVFKEQRIQAELELDLLDEQIGRARIIAPFDGVIVTGDLRQSLGSPLTLGDTLFEIAPLDSYRLKLQVNERDIDQIRRNQKGTLILNSLPHEQFVFNVTQITPVAEADEGVSFFVVEAELPDSSERLRPRMEGFGKISVGERKLLWIWTHEFFDWVRLWVWTWWP